MTNRDILSRDESDAYNQTRAAILAAAERHFKQYGHAKTTIVDIANDCAMSHANVYRYFRNKSEIIDAVAERWLDKIIRVGEGVMAKAGTAPQRLRDLVLELHLMKKRELLRSGRVHDVLKIAARDGRPCIEAHEAKIVALFAAVVAYGNKTGEFACADTHAAGVALHAATIKFCHPFLVEQYQHQDLEVQLQCVLDIVIAGLRTSP